MQRKTIAMALVSTMAFALSACSADHTRDTLVEVKKAIKDDKAILIDVREADEWKDGHVDNAKHLALSELKEGVTAEKLKSLIPAGKVVYLHCAAGGRCLKAAELLKVAGYETRPLKPGYSDLIKAGFEKVK